MKLTQTARAIIEKVMSMMTVTREEDMGSDMYSYHLVSPDRSREEVVVTPQFMPIGEMVQMGIHKYYVVSRRKNNALDTAFTKDYERVFFFLVDDSMWTRFEGSADLLDTAEEIVEKATFNIVEKYQASTPEDQRIHLEEYHAVFMAATYRTDWLS